LRSSRNRDANTLSLIGKNLLLKDDRIFAGSPNFLPDLFAHGPKSTADMFRKFSNKPGKSLRKVRAERLF